MDKIDFVLPWVDGNEQQWKKIRSQYKNNNEDKNDVNADARFRDMGTLKYSLRAIEKNCPWYNRIFLITKGYYPEWLNIEDERVVLVSEEELFIDKSHLPVFSSVAIEMNLVNLKGLSDKFVYMNDDFIIFRKIGTTRFFKEGKPVDFFSHNFIPRNKLFGLLRERDTWIYAINNVLALLNDKFVPIKMENQYLYHKSYNIMDLINNYLFQQFFKKLLWINHWHNPQPLLKETLHEVYEAFGDEMMKSSQNKFRSKNNLDQYIYRYWQLIKGHFYPYKHDDDLVANITSFQVLKELMQKLEINPNINFVCFNDSIKLPESEYEKVRMVLIEFLEKYFPEKASFER